MEKSKALTKSAVYRDAKNSYVSTGAERTISAWHLDFCRRYAGKKILDLGCATGDYSLELIKSGFECVGADVNEKYVDRARAKGLTTHHVGAKLPFADKSFDTVIMIEVLEHVADPTEILAEAARVARKNILISVPDCGGYDELRAGRLTFEHFLELDHVNFFTADSLRECLTPHALQVTVNRAGPISPWLFSDKVFPGDLISILLRKCMSLAVSMRLVKAKYYTTLFAILELNQR